MNDRLLAGFAEHLEFERGRASTTTTRYVRVLRRFRDNLEGYRGDISLEDVGREDIVRFMRDQGKVARSTYNSMLAAIRCFYTYLYRRELVRVNPADLVDRHTVRAKERLPLTLEESVSVIVAIERHAAAAYCARNIAILHLFIFCGLRVAEVSALSVGQVDLANMVLHGVRTKGGKALAVRLNDINVASLRAYLEQRRDDGLGNTAPLFLSDRGSRLSVRTVQRMVAHYGKLAGIDRSVTPHLLRHSTITRLAEIGTPLPVIQDIVGHSSIITTQKYVHLGGHHRTVAVNRLGEEFLRTRGAASA